MFARKHKKTGFSLVELMVVMGIMGILMAVGIPSAVSYMPTYRLREAARGLKANLEMAKITSIRRGQRCVICFSPQPYSDRGRVGSFEIFMDSNLDWTEKAADGTDEELLLPSVSMPPGVSLYYADFTDNGNSQADSKLMMGFATSGLADRSSSGTFVFGEARLMNNVGEYYRVLVGPTGQIRLETSQDGENWSG